MSLSLETVSKLYSVSQTLIDQCNQLTLRQIVPRHDQTEKPKFTLGDVSDKDYLFALKRDLADDESLKEPVMALFTQTRYLTEEEWLKLRAYGDACFPDELPHVDGRVLMEFEDLMELVEQWLTAQVEAVKAAYEKAEKKKELAEQAVERAWIPYDPDGPGQMKLPFDSREKRQEKREVAKQMADAVENEPHVEVEPGSPPPGDLAPETTESETEQVVESGPLAGVNTAIAKSLTDAGFIKAKKQRNGKANGAAEEPIASPEVTQAVAGDLAELEAL